MCSVRFMLMCVDESVDVFTDGLRLQLSPCGSEFMIEKQLSASAHPLQTRDRVRQRTRFAISQYKEFVLKALAFRNKYATYPYLPEELIKVEFNKTSSSAITEVEWPESDSCTTGPDGEITVCSLDGHAKLILSSSGEEFTVEFICPSSRNEVQSQNPQLQSHQHKSTCLLSGLSSKSAKGLNLSEASAGSRMDHPGSDINSPNTERLESTKLHVYTRVIQQFSTALCPKAWFYPLSLALKHWESLKSKRNTVVEQNRNVSTDGEHRQTPQTGQKTQLPKPLPLKCASPHQHKWKYDAVSPDLLEQEEEVTAELVKVVWCKGVIYRIVDGVIPMVEISPGDGSVIRSNGVLENYFTHYKAGAVHTDVMECVYYLCGLPPDVPGQLYSVQSVVTRANRILKCFIQARGSLRTPPSLYCWNEQVCDCVRVVQEVTVAGTGHFKALSDGTVEVLFLDGVRAQMMWMSDTYTAVQCGEVEQSFKAQTRPSHKWCQLNLPDGHQTLVQVDTDKTYQRYVSVVVQWCDWVNQTEQSMTAMGVALSVPTPSDTPQPITCRSVVSELEKIKRFNFLLDNSPILRSSGRSLSCERSSDLSEIKLTETCVSEALQKTSKAIQDIDNLLSDRP